jgi:Domain of unknown function (DUF1929)/Glyoxal oxidase N-terminus
MHIPPRLPINVFSVRSEARRHSVTLIDKLLAWLLWSVLTTTLGVYATAQTPTAGISANPTSITAGGSSTLTWTSTNAVSADINGTAVALNGSQVVTPTTTTTYRFTAKSASGATDWGQVTVTVSGGTAPTAAISANPTTISPGGTSTLTWSSTNATSATLNGAPVAVNGSQNVSPTATTTYTFIAKNASGTTATAQASVSVSSSGGGAPTAGISAAPTSIIVGGSSTLTWTSTNAVSGDLNGTPVPVNGSQAVSPTTTTTYRFTAKSASGATDWGQVSVTVNPGTTGTVGQWTSVQTWPFMAAHAHLLPNGKVLFWPSFAQGNNPTLWDPISNTFSTPPKAAYNIFCSGHSFLPDGRLFVTGGHAGNNSDGLITTSVYDVTQNSWTQTRHMNDARWYPTNTTLPSGDVLVVSGYTVTGTYNTLPQVWHPSTNSFTNLTTAQLMQPLYPMMFVAPNGQVFNAGPNRTSRYLDTSGTGAWTIVGNFNYIGTRDFGSAVMLDSKVMIAGGDGSVNTIATNTAEVIDLSATNPVWQSTSSMANNRRQLNLTILADGKVLATGGSKGFGFDNSSYSVHPAEMWDPVTGKWTTMASIGTYRGYHSTALLLPDGRVLSAGGEQTGASAEIYSPPYLFNGSRPSITSSPTSVKYAQTFFVGTSNATSIAKVTWIRLSSVTHAFNQNQRLNTLKFTQASGGLNITAPANAKFAPPGHYMLFIVNSSGVPSVAKIIGITN